ncbi:MAG: ribosomal-processing cysteine protease Prp [Clostridiales bacterium]|nr:ribosomal-processing cysteine protease Prp [Clostridiales bacterium]MBS5877016.1 ribosomal-processing cysteine protease Prp [Clostridiales bacterium]
MIKIYNSATGITIRGHAGYAPQGQDIVCAAVSALAYNLIASIKELTTDRIEYTTTSGDFFISHRTLSDKANLLVRSFFVGVKNIADSYPGTIEITDQA